MGAQLTRLGEFASSFDGVACGDEAPCTTQKLEIWEESSETGVASVHIGFSRFPVAKL